ncbi:MAG TPA: hypothetical protein VEC96_03300 [Anaerolineae bacterium]|nr:hypothetical protein [Anaerolineae bacterium]
MEHRNTILPETHHVPRITHHALPSKPHASSSASWSLILGLLLAGCGGAFLPWIWRDAVALQLTAPGLAEFVKFLPEVRYGQVQLQRLFFLWPLFLAMLVLPLLVENKQLILPRWLRWILRLAVIPLALAALSPVWTPAILVAPEFRLQTILAAISVGLAFIAPMLKSLPLKGLASLLVVGGLAGIVLPLWQFSLIQAGLAEAYHEPVSLGWGWWLTVAGVVIGIMSGVWLAFLGKQGLTGL